MLIGSINLVKLHEFNGNSSYVIEGGTFGIESY